eukprot:s370_g10.t1
MDGFLRALFLDKGFTEDQLDTIEAQDSELRHVGDLAAGATSEDDARVWAEELGLNSRVSKSRFVRSWIEARSQGSLSLDAGYTPSEPAKRAPTPVEEPPVESKFVEEELADDWNWVKLSSQAEMAMTPTPQQETRISDMLRSSLRSHGLTSIEVSQMEQTLEARSCKALATAASTFESAMRPGGNSTCWGVGAALRHPKQSLSGELCEGMASGSCHNDRFGWSAANGDDAVTLEQRLKREEIQAAGGVGEG